MKNEIKYNIAGALSPEINTAEKVKVNRNSANVLLFSLVKININVGTSSLIM